MNGSGKFALGNEDCIWIIQTTQLQKLSRLLFQYWIATALDHKEKFCSKSCFHSDQRALIRCQLAHRPQYWQRILSTVFWDPHQQFHHNVYCIRTILQSYSAFRNRSQCIQDRKTQFQTFGLQTRQQLNQLRNSPNAYQQNLNFWMQAHCSQEPQSRADSIWMPFAASTTSSSLASSLPNRILTNPIWDLNHFSCNLWIATPSTRISPSTGS